MDWLGLLGLIIALLAALGTILNNRSQSRRAVRAQEFTELRDTVDCLSSELALTRSELRTTRDELRAAEGRIEELETENRSLKGRVQELEDENQELRAKLQRKPRSRG